MIEKLQELLNNSYSPYSNFPVAAVVVTKDGKEFSGVNVEDASYRAGACAERVALFSALAAGYKKKDFKEIHIMTKSDDYGTPCGTCRQLIYELCDSNTLVRCYRHTGEYNDYSVSELCPYFFGEDDLS